MKAKEKANELVESFLPYSDYNECDVFTQRENQLKNAKQCALICIDEIIKELTEEISPSVHGFRHNYWKEVKQEIK
jgi:hypothetical protein